MKNNQFPTRLIRDPRGASKDLFIQLLTRGDWMRAKLGETRLASNGAQIQVCGLAWDATNQAFTV